MKHPKLIVLRGPSGSGKSTIAKMVFEQAKQKICLIDQDYYRFIFKPAGGGRKTNVETIREMIKANVLVALHNGYDVILEGILNVKSYGSTLNEIFAIHPKENYIFYLDVSFEETVKRHGTKPAEKVMAFGGEEMKEWYPSAGKLNHKAEIIIPEHFSIKETTDHIINITKLIN